MAAAKYVGAGQWVPDDPSLTGLREAVQACEGCDLYREATQGVMGDGDPGASLVLLGEQPGDQEDRAGEPFVGPAGKDATRASPTPRPRANGATHIEISSRTSGSFEGTPLAIPTGAPSSSATRLIEPASSSRARQRSSRSPSPCQSASREPNAAGSVARAARRRARQIGQSSEPRTRSTGAGSVAIHSPLPF